jgi:hypothetical protein
MSDNPRMPGHPSDMSSSRSSGSSSNAASSNYNTNTPSPYPPAPSHSSNNHTRNIILGAIATVFTSTLIYYLTVYQNRNKPEGSNRLEIKEATIEAWKSYKAYENTYTSNLFSFEKTATESGSYESYFAGLNTESKKFIADLTDLSKTKDIDKDLVKAFNRRLENEKSTLEKANEHYERIKEVSKKNTGNIKKFKEDFIAEQIRYTQYYKGAYERAINDIQEIAKILAERHGQPFSMSDFLIIQIMPQRIKTQDSLIKVLQQIDIDSNGNIVQQNIATNLKTKDLEGNWNVDGDVVSLQKNGVLNWTLAGGKKATGGWKVVEEKIKIEATVTGSNEKINNTYRVSNLTATSFTITQTEPPYGQFDVTRIVVN